MRRRIARLSCLLALGLGSAAPARAQTGDSVADSGAPALYPAVRATLEAGVESPELRALREFEERTFGRSTNEASDGPSITSTLDVSFLAGATLPDLASRWDDAVIRYLLFFRDDPHGQALMRAWYRRGNRYDESIRAALRASSAPEDLRCVALAESGFDPTARSSVGALGMWQFMPDTGAQYGLGRDRWLDERMDPDRSTRAAARYLRDLQRRFGSWELALAAYNMGYGALLRAIRKYNTNDYATLARVEAGLPFETTVYVSKIVACGIVLRNPERFGLSDVSRDSPTPTALVRVPGGTSLARLAEMTATTEDDLARLNPHLVRRIVPPSRDTYEVRIPAGARAAYDSAAGSIARAPDRLTTLRFGETLADLASRYGISEADLRARNRLESSERVVGPTRLVVPNVDPRPARASGERSTVAVPSEIPTPTDRVRVFYRVVDGDELDAIAAHFDVSTDDVLRWNTLDTLATLQSGQTLQLFVARTLDLADTVVLRDTDVRVVVAGSDEFFDWFETRRGRMRTRYRVETGDTLGAVAARFGLTLGDLARINRLPRGALLRVGQTLIVYTSPDLANGARTSPAAIEPATFGTDPAPP